MRKLEFQDAFRVARIFDKANLKDDVVDTIKKASVKGATQKDIGIGVLFTLVASAGRQGVENEIYELLADIVGLDAEKIKHQGMQETVEQFKQIAQENDLANFFKFVQAQMK